MGGEVVDVALDPELDEMHGAVLDVVDGLVLTAGDVRCWYRRRGRCHRCRCLRVPPRRYSRFDDWIKGSGSLTLGEQ